MNRALELCRRNETLYAFVRGIRDAYSYARGAGLGTFSQQGEDLFIHRRFGFKSRGFYVDVGASHPFRLSNTYRLYKHGWSGVTVEPIPQLGRLHQHWRPRDVLLTKAVGPRPGTACFREMLPSVLSTLDPETARCSIAEGRAKLLRSFEIEVITLDQLFVTYVGSRPVDLLTVDLEGLDAETIEAFALERARPTLICIEANTASDHGRIAGFLESRRYRLICELGCNLLAEDACL